MGLDDISSAIRNLALAVSSLSQGLNRISQPPTFVFATLPPPTVPLVVFCANALKPGESAGHGTGMLAFSDGHGWFSTAGTALAV